MSTYGGEMLYGGDLPHADVPLIIPAPKNAPHFDLPFRYTGAGRVVTVDQDSLDDVSNGVEAVLRTRPGQRLEIPEFGIEDPTFSQVPIREADLIAQVLRWEPRATLMLEQIVDRFDALHTTVNVNVSKGAQ